MVVAWFSYTRVGIPAGLSSVSCYLQFFRVRQGCWCSVLWRSGWCPCSVRAPASVCRRRSGRRSVALGRPVLVFACTDPWWRRRSGCLEHHGLIRTAAGSTTLEITTLWTTTLIHTNWSQNVGCQSVDKIRCTKKASHGQPFSRRRVSAVVNELPTTICGSSIMNKVRARDLASCF